MAPDPSLDDLDVAVAHWHVEAWGGAEYLVTELAGALDLDRVYTLGSPSPTAENPYGEVVFEDVVSTLDFAPARRLQNRFGRVFEYSLWEDVDWRDLGDPDLLVTSGATTRGVITPEDTLHVNYCHSPPRWFYDLYHDRKDSIAGYLARPLVRHLRTRDMTLDPRVDHYLANSPIIQRRLWKYYKRDADVVYPPVDVDSFGNRGDDGFYLHLGRLDEEKGVPALVRAFSGTEHELVLAGGFGDVRDSVRDQIERSPTIEYRGFVSEEEKRELLGTCRALVFNAKREDFGIVPIEANASGKPVLTRAEGFPARFVEEPENGYLHDGTAAGIQDAIDRFERDGISGDPRARVEQFSVSSFQDRLESTLTAHYADFQRTPDIQSA